MILRTMHELGFSLNIYCEAIDIRKRDFCYHSAHFEAQTLIQRFGWDFEISDHRAWFLHHFVCTKCGARKATMRLQNPPYKPPTDLPTIW